MLKASLPSDDGEGEEEVAMALGVCVESLQEEEDLERASLTTSEQRRNARGRTVESPTQCNNIESILEDNQISKTSNRKDLKRHATVSKPFNSPMLIASVVSASASSPASGGDQPKAEGDAAGASGASGSGRGFTNNLGSSGSHDRRVLAGTGVLGGSSSILEVLREESGTPVVEEISP